MNENIFQKRIKDITNEFGWSHSELSRLVGVTPQAVQRWFNGLSVPRQATLDKLSELTDKPISWFYSSDTESNDLFRGDRKIVFVSPDEELLISIFRDLPGEERRNLLRMLNSRLKDINTYIDELRNNNKRS